MSADPTPELAPPRAATDPEIEIESSVGPVDLTRWSTPPGRAVANRTTDLARRHGPLTVLVAYLIIGTGVAALATFLASTIYIAVRESDSVAAIDRPLLDWAISERSPALDTAVTWWTNAAGTIGMPILASLFLIGFVIRRRRWTPVILMVAAAGGSLLMTIAGKELIGRSRPPHADAVPPYEHSPSFPSGHTLNATAIIGVIVYLLLLRQARVTTRVVTVTVGALAIFSVGASRVFLGHHWFTDVLAAWALGAAWLALVITAHRLYLTARQRAA